MVLTILTFLIIVMALVLSHELGHFIFAKMKGVKVDEFAFGFPPRIFSVQKGETKYSFNILPLGGYVKIQGEDGEVEGERSFSAQGFWSKILILLAGILFNLLLAYFLISSVLMVGVAQPLEDNDPSKGDILITDIQGKSPAEAAGLIPGDKIIEIKDSELSVTPLKVEEVRNFIRERGGESITLKILRGEEAIELDAIPKKGEAQNEGMLGIGMMRVGIKKISPPAALVQGFSTTINLIYMTAVALGGFFKELFTGQASFQGVSGPVGIVNIVGDFSRFGMIFLIQLTAILSINLGLINLIPFPGLDGGRAFLLILEKLKGSPFNWKFARAYHATGFAILILLMILITYHDILKLVS